MRNAAALLHEVLWAELHPDPDVRAARRRLVEARERLAAAHLQLRRADLEFELAEARQAEREAAARLLAMADMRRPQ